ncbi:hypothetical protein COLSTE_02579 [Collinsella stercoris DSM 13279]|uniref:Uncharacterized protein n=1 Tax=Collinsella stercoris DSM 13279 TaxID=445975 RepID=B6GEN3_9ACTN|nr:hypothetical protein COLSTE_02579 [Collinsella stercoris DSM 13279]
MNQIIQATSHLNALIINSGSSSGLRHRDGIDRTSLDCACHRDTSSSQSMQGAHDKPAVVLGICVKLTITSRRTRLSDSHLSGRRGPRPRRLIRFCDSGQNTLLVRSNVLACRHVYSFVRSNPAVLPLQMMPGAHRPCTRAHPRQQILRFCRSPSRGSAHK